MGELAAGGGAEVAAAHGDVALVAADLDLGAFAHGMAVGAEANVHSCFAAAVADSFEFDEVVGPAEESGGAVEEVALEIGTQAVAEDRDVEVIGHGGELLDLGAGEELGLVDEHAGEEGFGVFNGDASVKIFVRRKRGGGGLEADGEAMRPRPAR